MSVLSEIVEVLQGALAEFESALAKESLSHKDRAWLEQRVDCLAADEQRYLNEIERPPHFDNSYEREAYREVCRETLGDIRATLASDRRRVARFGTTPAEEPEKPSLDPSVCGTKLVEDALKKLGQGLALSKKEVMAVSGKSSSTIARCKLDKTGKGLFTAAAVNRLIKGRQNLNG